MIDIVSKSRVILGLRKGGCIVIRLDQLPRSAVDLHLEDVKTRLEPDLFGIEKVGGGTHNVELLALIDGVLTAEVRAHRAGLDLDKNNLFPVAGDDVNLAEFVFIILFQNFIMLLFEICGGELIAQRTEVLVGKWFHELSTLSHRDASVR